MVFDLASSRWLVTGASSGLGRSLVFELASRGASSIELAARRKERLVEVADQVASLHGVEASVNVTDLASAAEIPLLVDAVEARGPVNGLALNAGVTYYGKHGDMTASEIEQMVGTNVTGPLLLLDAFINRLRDPKGDSAVLIVSSTAGDVAVPYQAAYSGTKAFLTTFGLAVREELADEQVSVTVFSPAGINTEMISNTGLAAKFADHRSLMDPDQSAKMAVDAVAAGKAISYPGVYAKVGNLNRRLLPRTLNTSVLKRVYRPTTD
jgi:short-subunit dehydrogenase